MKYMKIAAVVMSASLLVAENSEAKHPRHKHSSPKPAIVASASPDSELGAKIVYYGPKDVVKLNTKVRLTTLVELPKNEQILDFVTGDRDLWVINGNQNLAYVKPAKEGITTNLNLITASGNIYSFLLVEVSEVPGAQPDLKVFVEPKEESMIQAAQRAPNFVAASRVGCLQAGGQGAERRCSAYGRQRTRQGNREPRLRLSFSSRESALPCEHHLP